jgi:hypothetical protein
MRRCNEIGDSEMPYMMSMKRFSNLAFFGIVTFACVLSLSTRHAFAQFGDDPTEENKENVIKEFCRNDGKLATCVGLSGSDCPIVMRPFVDKCYAKRGQFEGSDKNRYEAFMSCFWSEFHKKYALKIQDSDECLPPNKGVSPLQPLPPDLEAKMKPLNPPGSKNAGGGELGY